VLVANGYAYLALMWDTGATMVDLRNPKQPRVVAWLACPPTHMHRVLVCGDLILVYSEQLPGSKGGHKAGLGVLPRGRSLPTSGTWVGNDGPGVHRFGFA